jgi:hypothetical protein
MAGYHNSLRLHLQSQLILRAIYIIITALQGLRMTVMDIRPIRGVCLHSNLTAKSCFPFAVHAKYDLSQNLKSVSFLIPFGTKAT